MRFGGRTLPAFWAGARTATFFAAPFAGLVLGAARGRFWAPTATSRGLLCPWESAVTFAEMCQWKALGNAFPK